MFLKKLCLFIVLSCVSLVTIAQQKPASYQSLWNKVDSLITKKGLTQSALAEVNKIYAKAKKENNDAQVIKALLYRMNLQEQKTEDAAIKNIAALENEIAASKEPAKSILLSIHAEQYWQYLQQNRWKFYDRTNTSASAAPPFKKADIATWSIDDFHSKISELYLASIRNKNILQQTRLEPYDAIIIKGNVRHLRPTLYDLLAHRALDYFKNDERTITKPAYAFEIRDDAAFADAASFARFNFTSRDSLSLHFKALKLFQELIGFHLNDAKPDALIDVDIDRIQFANSYGVMANKEALYKEALENLTKKYEGNPASAQAWYLLAEYYANKAREYNPLGDTANRYAFITAREICEKVIAQNQTSSKTQNEGAVNCYNLLKEILQKELNLQTEKVNVPGMPFRLLVSYRNFTQLHFRLIKIDKKTKDNLGNDTWQDDYWKELLQLKASKTFSQTLPDTKDHQNHAVEVKIDALPVGEYALLSSIDKQFPLTKNPLAVQFFYVSNIAYINNNNDYFVLHRQTGQPLSNAKVQVWLNQYDYNTRRNTNQKAELLTTDKNGYAKIPAAKNGRGNAAIRLEVFYKDDYLFLDDQTYSYYQAEPMEQSEKETRTSFLFTDRSIYRPGQTVYFKGIVVNRNNKTKESSVADNFKTTIVLYDVNNQKLDSIQLTTNQFGSYSGKFTLPGNVLNGAFRIQDEMTRSDEQISVEEYKRPKFYTEIQKPSGTYKLNDEIQVTGTAKAYAGNNIDGATVKYRVVRKIRFPLWWDYGFRGRIWPPYSGEEMEISNGATTTNANGEFTIRFKAIPDEKISKKDQPIFYYEVSADVTDINGETRSGNTSVAVAYQSLQLNIELPEKLHTDSLKNIKVSTTNLNGIFEKATVTVTVHKLQTPTRIFRARYWQQPDQFVMSREEYYQHFPYDIYKDENEPRKWNKLEQVTAKTDTTSKSSQFTIHPARTAVQSGGHSPFTSGWYVIEATTKDKNGEEVKAIRYVQLFNKNIISPLAYGSIETNQETIEPGEKANYQLSTNLDSVFLIHDIAKAEKDPERKFISLNKESKSFEIPVAETDRGGIGINMAFIKHNRIYIDNLNLNIPFTNKQLIISYQTYRDKTLPGSEEKWKVKISGYKGDKVAAEMLTAMYDASLDQFKPHNWRTPSLWNKNISAGNWNGNINFIAVQSLEKYNTEEQAKYFEKLYDRLSTLKGEYDISMMRRSKGKDFTGPPMPSRPDGRLQSSVSDAMEGKAAGIQVESNQAMNEVSVTAATKKESAIDNAAIQIRKNFNETAFFFPDLKTDSVGNIEFSFSMPEALTQWKWMTLVHTKELAFAYSEKNIVTQKQLMVQPNAPRFLREGDRMDLSGKIVNLSEKELTGQVELQLIDATSNQPVDGWFKNVIPNQYFTVAAGQSVPVSFSIEVPYQYNKPVIYRIVASTKAGTDGALSDGEENMLPVVSNRMLVTESLPLNMRGVGTKQFKFEKLLSSTTGNESTLNHHAITVEYTGNPAWYAVQALPYLKENVYECADQMFNRYYANALALKIANSSPRIKQIFEQWKTIDTAALLSNLQKNEELKSVLLQETPWVLEAKTEAEQKRNIALLYDMVKMSSELESSLSKLQEMQSSNGGFVWFKGGPDDRYMTQYILTGIGHLKKLNAIPTSANNKLQSIIKAGLSYLDKRIKEDYDNLVKYKTNLANNNLGYYQIQYLYMRSFFAEHSVPGETFKSYNYYRKQSQQFWLQQNKYMQGMIALSLHRTGDVQTAKNITASLKQTAIVHEELGMYWKEMSGGYYWHQAPVESQALLIETFAEVTNDTRAVDDMKTWLLKQKQTQNWRTTKATADACYALLLQGTDWLTNTPNVKIQLGSAIISTEDAKAQGPEAGTGYIKKTIEGKNVKSEMGNITVTVSQPVNPSTNQPTTSTSWGAVYWQYFENLDKITTAATPLSLTKKLFVEKNTDRGPVLQPVADNAILKVGDKIKVRIELRVDRNMEYVHMKDMRAAAMEPVNVISQYKWQGGLGYYESTKDASTHFFFNWLPKGTYVFEYPLFVTHTGTFSNGVTTIQCMYAPEFTSHSEGVKVNVE